MTSPARALRDKAEFLRRPGDDFAFMADEHIQPGAVLLAISTKTASYVMAIDKTEYSGVKTAELLGFHVEQPKARR